MIMKWYYLIPLIMCCSCQVYKQELETTCNTQQEIQAPFSKETKLLKLLDELLATGVPGVALAVHSNEGWWQHVGGYAKIEDKTKMETCHLHYLQSVAKTYQAVAILKLYEEGQIDLDQNIAIYLPEPYKSMIPRADEITVRMLLRHSSGIPEYNDHPKNITQLLQTPEKFFTTKEYFKVLDQKPLDFEPDSRYSYRNSNYELLSLIADQITGDHAKHMQEVLFKALQLNDTYYRGMEGYLEYPQLYNCYWDRHSDGILENVSQMQRTNVASMIGDDGIVATPVDAIIFLKGLMEGKIIQKGTLEKMKEGFILPNGRTEYGLGLDRATFDGKQAYGHSGGGLGAGCQLYYMPHNNTYFFIGINMGTITEGLITDAAQPILSKILKVLASP